MKFPHENTDSKCDTGLYPPFSLRPEEAERHFGIAKQTLYQWISEGKLIRGKHYFKIGRITCIIRDEFINFMLQEDGANVKLGTVNI